MSTIYLVAHNLTKQKAYWELWVDAQSTPIDPALYGDKLIATRTIDVERVIPGQRIPYQLVFDTKPKATDARTAMAGIADQHRIADVKDVPEKIIRISERQLKAVLDTNTKATSAELVAILANSGEVL
jgi:hypothetical protein